MRGAVNGAACAGGAKKLSRLSLAAGPKILFASHKKMAIAGRRGRAIKRHPNIRRLDVQKHQNKLVILGKEGGSNLHAASGGINHEVGAKEIGAVENTRFRVKVVCIIGTRHGD